MTSEAVNLSVDPLERRFGVVSKALAVCAEHGKYAAIISKHREEPSGCPACAEVRRQAQDKADQEALQLKIAAGRIEQKLGSALIPKRFQGKSFADYQTGTAKQEKYLSACVEYAENFRANFDSGRCLLLLGKPGTGKTHLAAAIADRIIRMHGATAVYRTVSGILQYIKGSYGDSEYSEADAFASLAEPDLLVIDEVGATKPTEFEQATIFHVINSRYEEQRPTIVVSNLGPDGLKAAIGDRCMDRLREGGGKALVFDWDSARSGVKA